eukprot:m.71587 g.71587  ORF g.71587 m.71587 type:complete len:318 (+) comp11709_c0_seq1:592-1545(+)
METIQKENVAANVPSSFRSVPLTSSAPTPIISSTSAGVASPTALTPSASPTHVQYSVIDKSPVGPVSIPWKATAVAASFESFYRSGLNALINRRLTGARLPFFPSMHVQVPTRVLYITGFKAVRNYVDATIQPEKYVGFEKPMKLVAAVLPGLFMTPISSVLEACNASQSVDPLYKRWTRGILARSNREIIFGIGLNQLTDNLEMRLPTEWSSPIRNAVACVGAGVVAGYLSHIPHNLSTLKLINPSLSYAQHMMALSGHYKLQLGFIKNPRLLSAASMTLAIVAPRGLIIRTAQVVGTFMILNGFIQAFKGTLDGL